MFQLFIGRTCGESRSFLGFWFGFEFGFGFGFGFGLGFGFGFGLDFGFGFGFGFDFEFGFGFGFDFDCHFLHDANQGVMVSCHTTPYFIKFKRTTTAVSSTLVLSNEQCKANVNFDSPNVN